MHIGDDLRIIGLMNNKVPILQVTVKELIFQLLLNGVVFVFYAFERHLPGIEPHSILFYLSYAIAGLVINYTLLPAYFYNGKYWQFVIYCLLVVGVVIFVEEAFLEKIFYPDTRGQRFLGVFYNLLSTLPTITILVGFKFAWDAVNQQREVVELRDAVKESQLQYLKSQINPHFLFNNINNLYSYAVEQSPRTPGLLLELSAVLRYMLYECKADFVSLKKELQHLKNYINLSELQIEGRGKISATMPEVAPGFKVAPLILSVFVENAFKHSSFSQTDDIRIDVDVSVDQTGVLTFKCVNSYVDQSNSEGIDSGIGLENVKKRLDIIYPDTHMLDIQKTPDLYKVTLTINLHEMKSV